MKLGKQAVKVFAVFAVLFVVGFALKFLNLHEGFVNPEDFNDIRSYMDEVEIKSKDETNPREFVKKHFEKGGNHFN